jgi:hypothetical protein
MSYTEIVAAFGPRACDRERDERIYRRDPPLG